MLKEQPAWRHERARSYALYRLMLKALIKRYRAEKNPHGLNQIRMYWMLYRATRREALPRSDAEKKGREMTPIKAKAQALDKETGKRLRAVRRMRAMTQATLAKSVGLTFQQLQKYERGTNRISVSMAVLLSECLEVPVTDLLPDRAVNPDPVLNKSFPAQASVIHLADHERHMMQVFRQNDPRLQASIVALLKVGARLERKTADVA